MGEASCNITLGEGQDTGVHLIDEEMTYNLYNRHPTIRYD